MPSISQAYRPRTQCWQAVFLDVSVTRRSFAKNRRMSRKTGQKDCYSLKVTAQSAVGKLAAPAPEDAAGFAGRT